MLYMWHFLGWEMSIVKCEGRVLAPDGILGTEEEEEDEVGC